MGHLPVHTSLSYTWCSILVTVMGWFHATTTTFLICCAPHLSSIHSWFIQQSSLLWLQQTHLVAKCGKTGWEMTAEFCLSISTIPQGILTCCKILWYAANSFTSSLKEVVLRIFIALKNPSVLAGFKHINLRSNGKHDIHYTTKNGVV
jgi:hypothetical protein